MNNICSICLEENNTKDNMQTYCGHIFHNECIQEWLHKHTSCPYCRTHIGKIEIDHDIDRPYIFLGIPPWRYYYPLNQVKKT